MIVASEHELYINNGARPFVQELLPQADYVIPEYNFYELQAMMNKPLTGVLLRSPLPELVKTNIDTILPHAKDLADDIKTKGKENVQVRMSDPAFNELFLIIRGLPVVIGGLGLNVAIAGTVIKKLKEKLSHKEKQKNIAENTMIALGGLMAIAGYGAVFAKMFESNVSHKAFPFPSEATFRRVIQAMDIYRLVDEINSKHGPGAVTILCTNVPAHSNELIRLLENPEKLNRMYKQAELLKKFIGPNAKKSFFETRIQDKYGNSLS